MNENKETNKMTKRSCKKGYLQKYFFKLQDFS